jgi:hypothetical protein
MTGLNDLGRRSFLKIAAAFGGASAVGALPNLAGTQDTPQQTDNPRRSAQMCLEAIVRASRQGAR